MAQGDGCLKDKGRDKKGKRIWEVVVSCGKNPVTGKYESISRTVHGTQADARKVRDELLEQRTHSLLSHDTPVTFGQLATDWFDERQRSGSFSRTTLDDNRTITNEAVRLIGNVPVAKVTPRLLSDLLKEIQTRNVRPLSNSRMRKYRACINQILKRAACLDLIAQNPCERVPTPSNAITNPRHSLSRQELPKLQAALDDFENAAYLKLDKSERERMSRNEKRPRKKLVYLVEISRAIAVRIAMATGMRRGEILALDWDAADLGRATLRVDKSYTVHAEVKAPKSLASNRLISIDKTTCDHLKKWKDEQALYLERVGVHQTNKTPVVCSSIGGHIGTSAFSKWWAKQSSALGFEGLKLHELRHTQATILLACGIDIKTVQMRLGHSSASLTLNLYAHAVPENDRKAAVMLSQCIQENA